MCKNSSDSFQREQSQGLKRTGFQMANGQRTITRIQKAEAFKQNKNMIKPHSYITNFSRDFFSVFYYSVIFCCLVKHLCCLKLFLQKIYQWQQGKHGAMVELVQIQWQVVKHTPQLQLRETRTRHFSIHSSVLDLGCTGFLWGP